MNKKTKVIAFSDTKGGIGKTTSTINVAYCIPLVEPGAKVLVIDIDSQGNASQTVLLDDTIYYENNLGDLLKKMITGYEPTIEDILDRIYIPEYTTNKIRLDKESGEYYYLSAPYGFDIFPTTIAMQIVEMNLSMKDPSERGISPDLLLKKIVDLIKEYLNYDYILIDCPPNMGRFVRNAILTSDFMMIPAGLGIYALSGVEYTLTLLDVIEEMVGYKLEVLGIFSSIYRKGLTADYTDKEILRRFSNKDKFLANVPHTVSVDNATIEGWVASMKNKKIRTAYIDIAKEMLWKMEHLDEMNEERTSRAEIVEQIDLLEEVKEEVIDLIDEAERKTGNFLMRTKIIKDKTKQIVDEIKKAQVKRNIDVQEMYVIEDEEEDLDMEENTKEVNSTTKVEEPEVIDKRISVINECLESLYEEIKGLEYARRKDIYKHYGS